MVIAGKRLRDISIEGVWNYTEHARYYNFRPNYDGRAIDILIRYVGADVADSYRVADIGAGTGNLTILLLDRGLSIFAIEPNDEMRSRGVERTSGYKDVCWIKADGVNTGLKEDSMDWVTFGSSFNVLDRHLALQEAYRVLKKGGFFTCMWNHRDLNDPIQREAEGIIMEFIPEYDRGVRREDQRPIIEEHNDMFRDIFYMEVDFTLERTIDAYLNAWRSVRNRYWDLSTGEGRRLFEEIAYEMRKRLPERFDIKYTTRAWTARRVD